MTARAPGDTGQASDGIEVIDLRFMETPGVIASFVLPGEGGLTLIETGPATTLGHLEAGLRAAGHDLSDIERIIVTHIHLDHSGGAGTIMREHPRIRLGVHPIGAPHLVDPARLLSSAARVYGDDLGRLFGDVVGVPADRIDPLSDGEIVTSGGRSLRVLFTPGHASHHVAILDEATGTLFAGDAAGARVPGADLVVPTTTPPELDPEAWAGSLDTIREAGPKRLALTHFGIHDDVDTHLDRLSAELDVTIGLARETLTGGGDIDALAKRLLDRERAAMTGPDAGKVMDRLELAIPAEVAALGLHRYLRKRGEVT
jgi:glyoxylase-like metal-dependent hydrolase (beta-lactamase superfamily II)